MIEHSPVPKFNVIEGKNKGNPDFPVPTDDPYYHKSQESIVKSIRQRESHEKAQKFLQGRIRGQRRGIWPVGVPDRRGDRYRGEQPGHQPEQQVPPGRHRHRKLI